LGVIPLSLALCQDIWGLIFHRAMIYLTLME